MIIDDKLMKYVIFQKRTEAEVRQKCQKLNYAENYTEEVVEYLKENEYINDEKYVEKYIANVMKLKKASIYEIKINLLKKGVDEKYIDAYVSERYDELIEFEEQSAKKIVKKKIAQNEKDRIKRYLKSKGYLYNSISMAIDMEQDFEDND